MAIFVKHPSFIFFSFTLSLALGWFEAKPAQATPEYYQARPCNRFDFGPNFYALEEPTGKVNKSLCIPPRSQVRAQSVPLRQIADDRSFLFSSKSVRNVGRVQAQTQIIQVQRAPVQPPAAQPRIICGDGEVYVLPPLPATNPGTPLVVPAKRAVATSTVSGRRVQQNPEVKIPAALSYGSKGYSLGASAPGAYTSGQGYAQAVVKARIRPEGE